MAGLFPDTVQNAAESKQTLGAVALLQKSRLLPSSKTYSK